MRAIVSFHPARPEFFDEVIGKLVAGAKINPESYLVRCLRHRRASWHCSAYIRVLQELIDPEEPPEQVDPGILRGLRSRLDRLTRRPDLLAETVKSLIDPAVHLRGRPFFITEGSADRVSRLVADYADARDGGAAESLILEQLVRLDPDLAGKIEPAHIVELSADLSHRAELLDALKAVYSLARAARAGESWGPPAEARRPAREVFGDVLPWYAIQLHSRATPFWIAEDVDGLATVCAAAGIEPPACMTSARPLFAAVRENFPTFGDELSVELSGGRSCGAYVAPGDVPELIDFLNMQGTRIIQAASRFDEGRACSTLLRKIRECATFAGSTGAGYVEATGIGRPEAGELPRL